MITSPLTADKYDLVAAELAVINGDTDFYTNPDTQKQARAQFAILLNSDAFQGLLAGEHLAGKAEGISAVAGIVSKFTTPAEYPTPESFAKQLNQAAQHFENIAG